MAGMGVVREALAAAKPCPRVMDINSLRRRYHRIPKLTSGSLHGCRDGAGREVGIDARCMNTGNAPQSGNNCSISFR